MVDVVRDEVRVVNVIMLKRRKPSFYLERFISDVTCTKVANVDLLLFLVVKGLVKEMPNVNY